MIEFISLQALNGLVDFCGREPADFVSHVFDLSPRQVLRRAFLAVLLLTD
jgi:hypothetical protein